MSRMSTLEKSLLSDIADSLEDLGYKLTDAKGNAFIDELDALFNNGRESSQFIELVVWLCSNIRLLTDITDTVTTVTSTDDITHFLMEAADFLRSMECPYKHVYDGGIENRLKSRTDRLQLVDYLCSELQALYITLTKTPAATAGVNGVDSIIMTVSESEQAKQMMSILVSLEINESLFADETVLDVKKLMESINSQVRDRMAACQYDSIEMYVAVIDRELTAEQWTELQSLNTKLCREYSLRREMILTRLHVTLQSFTCSHRVKRKEDEFSRSYSAISDSLSPVSSVGLADLVAAGYELLQDDTICSAHNVHSSDVKKFMMGEVPQRGGDPRKTGPAAEMPKFKARNPFAGGGDGRRGGGGGGYRGNRGKKKRN